MYIYISYIYLKHISLYIQDCRHVGSKDLNFIFVALTKEMREGEVNRGQWGFNRIKVWSIGAIGRSGPRG